jgi:hypothetical protein
VVVGRSRCNNCDTANAVTRTYYRSIQASRPDRQSTVPPCLSHARTLSPLSAHTYTRRHDDRRLPVQPALCFSCLAAKCGVHVSVFCLRGCRGTRRAGSTRADRHADDGRRKAETAPSEWTRSRQESKHARMLFWRVSSRELFPVPLAACSGYAHHASPRRAVRPRVTSDRRHRRTSAFVRAAWRHGEHGSRPRAPNTPPPDQQQSLYLSCT